MEKNKFKSTYEEWVAQTYGKLRSKLEKYTDLIRQMEKPHTMTSDNDGFLILQALMFGYNLAVAEMRQHLGI